MNLKENILKSGIPLEASVLKKLDKYDFFDRGEVEFEKDGKFFSADICLDKILKLFKNLGIITNFVIECEYKSQDHGWYFTEFPGDSEHTGRKDVANEIWGDNLFVSVLNKFGFELKEFEGGQKGYANLRKSNLFNLPLVNKGVEIFEKGLTEKNIKDSSNKSIFGSIKSQKDSLQFISEEIPELNKEKFSKETKFPVPVSVISIPIVVTTAKIFKLKKGTDLEKIKKTKEIQNLLEEVPGVSYLKSPSKETINYMPRLFEKSQIKNPQKMMSLIKDSHQVPNFFKKEDFFERNLKSCNPTIVYIINYEYLGKVFSNGFEKIKKILESINKNIVKKE